MPDETQIWAVPTQVGKSPPYLSDNRYRNMKLNERLLNRKSRQKKLMLPSDCLFQKRNLSKFPMEYSRTEAKKNAEGQHRFRKMTEEKVRQARRDSETLRQYSLLMFDDVVDTYTHRIEPVRARSEIPSRIMSANNGPTSVGSVLYNKRSNVMNSIRLRPNSEPPTRFNHLKSEINKPELKQALCRSNRDYTVSCVGSTMLQSTRSVSTVSMRSDFMLIPTGSVCSDRQTIELDTGKSEVNDNVFYDNDMHSNGSDVSVDSDFLKRNLPTKEIHFYSIEEDSLSDESEIINTPDIPKTEEPKIELVPEPSPDEKSAKSGKGRPKSSKGKRTPSPKNSKAPKSPKSKPKSGKKSAKGKKGKEKEPAVVSPPPPEVKVEEAPPVRKPLKGPKCWVDDATITSEQEIMNEDDILSQTSKPGSATVTSKLKNDEIVPTLPEPEKHVETTMVLEEIEQYTPNGLPSWICPTSEAKSRKEEIKDWLSKCCFDSANRCVPLF